MLLSIGCGATPVAEPPPQEVNILDLTIDPSKVSPSETFYLEARTLGPAKSAKVNLKKANKVVASYQLNLETGNPTSIQIWTKVENRPPDEKGRYQAEVVATHLFEGKTKKAKKSLKKWILVVK
jgi:hypothetical protein